MNEIQNGVEDVSHVLKQNKKEWNLQACKGSFRGFWLLIKIKKEETQLSIYFICHQYFWDNWLCMIHSRLLHRSKCFIDNRLKSMIETPLTDSTYLKTTVKIFFSIMSFWRNILHLSFACNTWITNLNMYHFFFLSKA